MNQSLIKIFNFKLIQDFSKIYISYFFFIIFSIIFQIIATKYFNHLNSKLLIFLFAVYSWGSFFGEAGFSRYDISVKTNNQNILISIYLRKFISFMVILFFGSFFIDNIIFELENLTIFFLILSFFFSSLFIPTNLFKRDYKIISYLSNLLFIIFIFSCFFLNYKYNLEINNCLVGGSIILNITNLGIFLTVNKNINFQIKKLSIINFNENRINILNYISYLGCAISILIFFMITRYSDNNYYILFARLIDGVNSFFGLMAIVCIKKNILKNWKNILTLTSLLIIAIMFVFVFILVISDKEILFTEIFPLLTYFLITSGSLFIASSISQFKLEKRFVLLIKINIFILLICSVTNILYKFYFLNNEFLSYIFYIMSLISIYPIIYYTKIVKKIAS